MFRWLRDWWARRRGKRLLRRYDMVYHACGCGPVALRPGENCPYCDLSFAECFRDQQKFVDLSQEIHNKDMEERRTDRRTQ